MGLFKCAIFVRFGECLNVRFYVLFVLELNGRKIHEGRLKLVSVFNCKIKSHLEKFETYKLKSNNSRSQKGV